jgi:hypothetical protein
MILKSPLRRDDFNMAYDPPDKSAGQSHARSLNKIKADLNHIINHIIIWFFPLIPDKVIV